MKTSIYISSEKIEAVQYQKSSGGIEILESYHMPLQDGAMISGKIISNYQIIDGLESLKSSFPGAFDAVDLVLDGSCLFTKNMEVPKLKPREYKELVEEEYAENVENVQDLLGDYRMMPKVAGKPISILGCATEKQIIDSYLEVFEGAQIKVSKISVGVEAILHNVETNPALKESSFVLNIIDGITMISMIFENGINVFLSRTRLYYDTPGEMARRLHENISGLMQFNRSQELSDIKRCYYLGLSEAHMQLLINTNPYDAVQLEKLDIFEGVSGHEKMREDCVFAYMGATLPKGSMDFYKNYLAWEKAGKKENRPDLWKVVAVFAIVLVVISPVALIIMQNKSWEKQAAELQEYISDATRLEELTRVDSLIMENTSYTMFLEDAEKLEQLQQKYAPIGEEVLDLITKTNSDTVAFRVVDYDRFTSVLQVSSTSQTESNSAAYVEILRANPLVQNVVYTGYSYSSGADRIYEFSIAVQLKDRGLS